MSLVSVGIVRKPHRSEFIAAETNEQIFLVSKQLFFNFFVFLRTTNLIVLFQLIYRFGAPVPTSQLLPPTDPFAFPVEN